MRAWARNLRGTSAAAAGMLAAAGASFGAASVCERSAQPEEAPVLGTVVIFRHGARTPVFRLPGGVGHEVDWAREVLPAPPPHAAAIHVEGGQSWRVSAGSAGQLTSLGWAQGEALGRRLRMIYGPPAVDTLEVVSTDMRRTVETAHAVLTGLLLPGHKAPVAVHVESIGVGGGSPWVPNTRCAALSEFMRTGREALRAKRSGLAASTHSAIEQAFGPLYQPEAVGLLGVHDDCQARRWHGKPPSPCVDVSLCDAASREATREAIAALSAHGQESWRLSAGPMCHRLAQKIRAILDGDKRRLMLVSAHDTSLFTLLNAISVDYRQRCLSENGGSWPPYASCITIDVLANGLVRVRYQFDPLSLDANGVGPRRGRQDVAETTGVEATREFLQRLDTVALDPAKFRERCPEFFTPNLPESSAGTVFRWGA